VDKHDCCSPEKKRDKPKKMKSDFKILIGALVFTFLLIVGLAAIFGNKEETIVEGVQVEGLAADPDYYDLSKVPINGGIVTKEYEIENTTGKSITLKKIATSCMCTQAKVSVNGKETRFFGMEHPMDKNPPVNMELGVGKTAKVVVNFDPAAHGPEGVGPFERSVWLTFSDPAGVKELKFSGVVVN
jgi:hypothetical protein